MPFKFKYSCFISYRHNPYRTTGSDIVDKIYQKLAELLYEYNKHVFRDTQNLQKGNMLSNTLAQNLCHSAFMLIVYTPNYFDENHPWCAREYQAMLELEKRRFTLWGSEYDPNNRLIIPIICREGESFKSEFKDQLFYDWRELLLKPRFYQTRHFHEDISILAKNISDRCDEIHNLEDPCQDCENFTMPEPEATAEWIRLHFSGKNHQPAPFRR